MSLDKKADMYLDMTDSDIDKLLLNIDLVTTNFEDESENNLKDKNCRSQDLCSNCNSDSLVKNQNGERICEECGLVNSELYDEVPEFNNDLEGASRYGCPSNYFYPKSALGTKIRARGFNKLSNLQKQGQMPYREKSLLETLTKIQKKCKTYNISQTVIDSAKILYKKVSDCKHTKGKRVGKNRIMRCINLRSMIAACLFHACKLQGEPRSPKEIADIYDLEIKNVNKGCRKFLELIDIESLNTEFNSSRSFDFIDRFASKLNLSPEYIQIAKDISKNIHKLDIASTHEPPSVAAGCILMVSVVYRLDITKKQISDVFRISDVTISKTYRRIYPFHNIVMNNNITNLVTEKRNQLPRKKTDITKENLVVPKENFVFQSYEKSNDRDNILLTEDDDIDSSESSNKKIDISDSDSDVDSSVNSYTEDNSQVEVEV
jgi:transcription initiation factor TFIIB